MREADPKATPTARLDRAVSADRLQVNRCFRDRGGAVFGL